jgi:6-phosphogluconolactonase
MNTCDTTPVAASAHFAYVANFVSNDVSIYAIEADGHLQLQGSVPAGQAPLFITVHPSGQFAYVMNSQSRDITAYRIDAAGKLVQQGTAPVGVDASRAMAIHPAGQAAYVAWHIPVGEPRPAGLYPYVIDSQGNLHRQTNVTTGVTPRAMAVAPSGRFVYVADAGASTTAGGVVWSRRIDVQGGCRHRHADGKFREGTHRN